MWVEHCKVLLNAVIVHLKSWYGTCLVFQLIVHWHVRFLLTFYMWDPYYSYREPIGGID